MRAMTPWRVRPPWRSSESWSLMVWMIDSIHCRTRPSEPKRGFSSRRSGRSRAAPWERTICSNSSPAKPLSTISVWPGCERAFEQFGGDLALGLVGGGELEGDRHPVRGAEQVEAEAPEEARVGGAVAVGGVAGELGALDGLARLRAGNRRRVEQPQPVAEGGREPGQVRRRAARSAAPARARACCSRTGRECRERGGRAGAWPCAESCAPWGGRGRSARPPGRRSRRL